jgi:hypothetical protein
MEAEAGNIYILPCTPRAIWHVTCQMVLFYLLGPSRLSMGPSLLISMHPPPHSEVQIIGVLEMYLQLKSLMLSLCSSSAKLGLIRAAR